jgi:hypothetical protein
MAHPYKLLRRTKATRHDGFFSRKIGIPQSDDEYVGAASSRDQNGTLADLVHLGSLFPFIRIQNSFLDVVPQVLI